jgi:hypothetical protein
MAGKVPNRLRIVVSFALLTSMVFAATGQSPSPTPSAASPASSTPVKDLPHKYTDPTVICPSVHSSQWRARRPNWVEWPPDKSFCDRVSRDRLQEKKSFYVDDLTYCSDYQNEVDCHAAAAYGIEKQKEEMIARAEAERQKSKAPEPEEDLDQSISKAVSSAAGNMSNSWENSLQGRASALSQQIAQGLENAKARNAPSLAREFLENALLLAQAASSRNDKASLACAQEFLDGRPGAGCQAMSQRYRGGSAGGGSGSECDSADVSRAADVMNSCSVNSNAGLCNTYRGYAACMRRAAAAAGSCSVISNEFRESERQALASAAQVCTN